jgi:hypothetical protein
MINIEKLATPSERTLSPFADSYKRPREVKRDFKVAEALQKHNLGQLAKDTPSVSKQQAALEAGLTPGILPQKR